MAKNQKQSKKGKSFTGVKSAGLVMAGCFVLAEIIYYFIFGNPSHFQGSTGMSFLDPRISELQPVQNDLLGTIYKGGIIVPIIQTLLLTVLALSVERYFAIRSAQGKGKLVKFVEDIKANLSKGDLQAAKLICDKQQGSVANVVTSALTKYAEVEEDKSLSKEQQILSIQKEVEEATALELPMLSQNLPIIATITTLGTLMGLLGTVIGMIRSFSALAGAGGTDSIALSAGISEALINTAFGILTGALAVISYNYFTSKIDSITYCIDEVGFSIVQTFAASHK
jgi:biopolymer transport protein ExbB